MHLVGFHYTNFLITVEYSYATTSKNCSEMIVHFSISSDVVTLFSLELALVKEK